MCSISFANISFKDSELLAKYQVPTLDSELLEIATVGIPTIKMTDNTIELAMPEDLVPNESYNIVFERSKDNSNEFKSFFGEARCLSTSQETLSCAVTYNKVYSDFLTKNLPTTEQQIHSMNLPNDITSKKIQLARKFAGEPIGLILLKIL